MNVSRMATGMVTIGMTALGKCHKNTTTTIATTSISVLRALAIERRMSSERS